MQSIAQNEPSLRRVPPSSAATGFQEGPQQPALDQALWDLYLQAPGARPVAAIFADHSHTLPTAGRLDLRGDTTWQFGGQTRALGRVEVLLVSAPPHPQQDYLEMLKDLPRLHTLWIEVQPVEGFVEAWRQVEPLALRQVKHFPPVREVYVRALAGHPAERAAPAAAEQPQSLGHATLEWGLYDSQLCLSVCHRGGDATPCLPFFPCTLSGYVFDRATLERDRGTWYFLRPSTHHILSFRQEIPWRPGFRR